MKLVCIDTKDYDNGKDMQIHYWIIDDSGNVRGIDKKCFITLEEYRNNKIESIL